MRTHGRMRWALLAAAIVLGACSHEEKPGTTAGESVPAAPPVVQNAIPRDLPPATPPIPPTMRSRQEQPHDGGGKGLEVYGPGMGPREVPRPPPPTPVDPPDAGVSPGR